MSDYKPTTKEEREHIRFCAWGNNFADVPGEWSHRRWRRECVRLCDHVDTLESRVRELEANERDREHWWCEQQRFLFTRLAEAAEIIRQVAKGDLFDEDETPDGDVYAVLQSRAIDWLKEQTNG